MKSKLLNFFSPSDFKGDPYGWMTNQMSHVLTSMAFYYFTNSWLIVLLFWLIWEIRHLYISKNIEDFFMDLYFETIGVFILLDGGPLNQDQMILFSLFFGISLFIVHLKITK